jgi:hypothetical protein
LDGNWLHPKIGCGLAALAPPLFQLTLCTTSCLGRELAISETSLFGLPETSFSDTFPCYLHGDAKRLHFMPFQETQM